MANSNLLTEPEEVIDENQDLPEIDLSKQLDKCNQYEFDIEFDGSDLDLLAGTIDQFEFD